MTAISFNKRFEPRYGECVTVAPGIRRVVAENPGPFTFHGTGTYILGEGHVAVIDPGPDLPAHIAALDRALAGETIEAILITHTHRDHVPAARPLQALRGGPGHCPIYGHGPHGGSRGADAVEEGADHGFDPDIRIGDGAVVTGTGWSVEAVHTPGHTSNHLCFSYREAVEPEGAFFSGDHVMGWSTSVISPPDGDMADYLAALDKLLARPETRYYPTHGAPIDDAHAHVAGFIAHRRDREAQILATIAEGRETVPAMVDRIYTDIPPGLKPAAGRSVLAHLEMLVADGRVVSDTGTATAGARYRPGPSR
ncbi:MBL fold metallo-hydrolase [Marivibrio halodurans]|uniref:MBL fold metallo-hydrolase n=1 Tax=Marivibrio halodurans TaxID=2039722 RepID=A0A8J7SQC0_9PROT|nr:MBL fold metallo-hydrolase [Marivibrio halodurans]MBP5858966.1 MBL fold metallo-hydrolase [Marivibrio halodurans]